MFQELELAIESGKNVISLQCQLPERIKVIQQLTQLATDKEIPCYLWNLGTGTLECVGSSRKLDLKVTSPLNVVEALAPFSQDGFFILEDLHSFLNESSTDIKSRIAAVQMRSLLINLAFTWADTRKIAVLLGTQETELPPILGSKLFGI